MSGKGNCYDNAVTESFFGSVKDECVHRTTYHSREEARQSLFEYLEVFYNRKRRHSSLGYVSPVVFEQQWWAQTAENPAVFLPDEWLTKRSPWVCCRVKESERLDTATHPW